MEKIIDAALAEVSELIRHRVQESVVAAVLDGEDMRDAAYAAYAREANAAIVRFTRGLAAPPRKHDIVDNAIHAGVREYHMDTGYILDGPGARSTGLLHTDTEDTTDG